MSEIKPFDFQSFVSANAERDVSSFDYLHTVYKAHELTSDFIFYFAKLFWPDFKTVDGLVFIAELFDKERYHNLLNERQNPAGAQFWINLIEVTGLFDGLSTDQAMSIAKALVSSWNSKLHSEFGNRFTSARVVHDDETGEVFATISSAD